jgi:L-fuculose-phosphate aldolase
MNTPNESDLRRELVRASKVLYKLGIADLMGHLSVRLDAEHFLIKPRPVSWLRLKPDDLLVMDLDGRRMDGVATERPPVRESPIHTQVYRARPDVSSILHCHPFDSVMMATMGLTMEPINRDAMNFPYGVPVWDNRTCLVDHQTMVETVELGDDLARTLGNGRALIIKHHGIVIADRTPGDVVRAAYYLERAARAHLTAAMIKPQPFMSPDLARDLDDIGLRDPGGFGLSSPSRVVAEEQWRMLQEQYLDSD